MTSQTNRKSFIIHKDSLDILDKLSDEQAGKLFKAIHFYQKNQQIPKLDFAIDLVFTNFLNQFKRDEENYKNTCDARKIAGSKGGKSYYIKDSGIDNQGEMQFYVLKLFNEDENFIKIGISSAKLNRRFSGPKNMPYNYEILHQIINEKEALKLESYFSKKLENYKYQTAIKFPGHIECYKLEALSLIVNDDLFAQAKQSKSYQKVANLADSDSKNKNKNKSESESEIKNENKSENKNEIKNNSNVMENHNIENNFKGVEIEAVKNKFDEFWSFYTPVAGRDGSFTSKGSKAEAFQVYEKAIKKFTHEKIMANLEFYLKHCQKNARFTKHACSWLRESLKDNFEFEVSLAIEPEKTQQKLTKDQLQDKINEEFLKKYNN